MCDAEWFYCKSEPLSIYFRTAVSVTTLIAFYYMVKYTIDENSIFKNDNSLQSWNTVLLNSNSLYTLVAFLLLLCHPVPVEWFGWNTDPQNYIILLIPMFYRLLLPVRSLILHSQFFNSTKVQMLGALNHMNTGTLCSENMAFIIRHIMATSSGTVIAVFILVIVFFDAWIVYTSETYYCMQQMLNFSQSLDQIFLTKNRFLARNFLELRILMNPYVRVISRIVRVG